MKAKIDKLIGRFISKKLTVFLVGTVFISLGLLDGDQWMQLAVAYVGVQGFLDMVIAYKSN